MCKPVLQLSKNGVLIKEWPSQNAATKALNIKQGMISAVCNGGRKTCGGYKWKFKNKYEVYLD